MRSVLLIALVAGTAAAETEPEPAVDVRLHLPPPPWRTVAIELNPVPLLTIGKLSANLLIVPVEHHAIVLSPFYTSTTTAPIFVYDDQGHGTQLPEQKFTGFGAELGYRYYFGAAGPRGLFLGPSLVVARMTATAGDGTKTDFIDLGVAADMGYELLVADRIAVSLGAGLQVITTSKTIPDQQFPAKIYANGGVLPRVLFSIGAAL
jgi:hypothetical protein